MITKKIPNVEKYKEPLVIYSFCLMVNIVSVICVGSDLGPQVLISIPDGLKNAPTSMAWKP